MARKNKDYEREFPSLVAGRRPKKPSKKVGWPIRYLATPPIVDLLDDLRKKMGLQSKSDLQRLAMYRLLESLGEMTPEISEDPTWENLRQKGLV